TSIVSSAGPQLKPMPADTHVQFTGQYYDQAQSCLQRRPARHAVQISYFRTMQPHASLSLNFMQTPLEDRSITAERQRDELVIGCVELHTTHQAQGTPGTHTSVRRQ